MADSSDFANTFVNAALEDLPRAEELLAQHADGDAEDFHRALVLGDVDRVRQVLHQSPGKAAAKGGPRSWEPLLYVCFSRFAGGKASRAEALVQTAQLLLSHGVDANASYIDQRWPDCPLPALYGATGLNNNPALAGVLLDAGARPNDSESLYHSTEHADLACLRLLLERGASPASNVLKHMLDFENAEGVQLLLAAGADANEVNGRGETALHWAVWRGRTPAVVAALLDGGANIDSCRKDGRTAYALAVRSGQTGAAVLMQSRGADTGLSPDDRFLGDCAAAVEAADLNRLLANRPQAPLPADYNRSLPEFTSVRCVAGVRALLALGVPVDTQGDSEGTALHWACWKGYPELVTILLEHGASVTIKDARFQATPVGWFFHGLENCAERDGDYPQVARLLLAAGAPLSSRDIPTGNAAVDAVLRAYKLI